MKIKRIMSEVKLVIADLEIELNGSLRSSPTLCAFIENTDGSPQSVVPLNTPDGRPIFMKIENAIKL